MLPHYAIGDVHGRDDLLALLLERIVSEHHVHHPAQPGVIVYVGDYIDRGAHSREVMDRVMRGLPGFETVCLKGNHEELLLNCFGNEEVHHWETWLQNGGEATAAPSVCVSGMPNMMQRVSRAPSDRSVYSGSEA